MYIAAVVGVLRPLPERLWSRGRGVPALRRADPSDGVHEPLESFLPALSAQALLLILNRPVGRRSRAVSRTRPRGVRHARHDAEDSAQRGAGGRCGDRRIVRPTFDQDRVAPPTREGTVRHDGDSLAPSHAPEAGVLVQAEAGGVLGEHRRLDGPDA